MSTAPFPRFRLRTIENLADANKLWRGGLGDERGERSKLLRVAPEHELGVPLETDDEPRLGADHGFDHAIGGRANHDERRR